MPIDSPKAWNRLRTRNAFFLLKRSSIPAPLFFFFQIEKSKIPLLTKERNFIMNDSELFFSKNGIYTFRFRNWKTFILSLQIGLVHNLNKRPIESLMSAMDAVVVLISASLSTPSSKKSIDTKAISPKSLLPTTSKSRKNVITANSATTIAPIPPPINMKLTFHDSWRLGKNNASRNKVLHGAINCLFKQTSLENWEA